MRGKHLDNLRAIDIFCIGFSKANTGPFTYFYLRYCWNSLPWQLNEISFRNALLPLPLIFLLFDATYAATHYVLHWQCLYPYIHKHHHVQKAPSRANVDAVNVHPVEFILGEYNHWFVIHVWTTVARQPLHAFTAFAFLVIGGILAGINHTRYDIVVSFPVPQKCVLAWYRSRTAGTFASSATPTKANGVNQENWIWIPIYDSKAHDVHHRIPQSK